MSDLYSEFKKFITYVPAQGYLWTDGNDWHGPYKTEEEAIEAFVIYLDLCRLDD